MRSRCWCSAALVLALAGCGGSGERRRAYDYDAHAPVELRVGGLLNPRGRQSVSIRDASFRGANGTAVRAFLLEPRDTDRHAAVLFLHGAGGSRADLLLPAAELAERGFVTMTISLPRDAATYRPLVVDARRALDALGVRHSVDAKRIGLVGYSLGAQTAAIVAGVDPRPRAVALVAGRGTARARQFVRRTHARVLVVGAAHDERVPRAQLVALARAVPGRPRIRWYATGHALDRRAFDDVVAWELRALR